MVEEGETASAAKTFTLVVEAAEAEELDSPALSLTCTFAIQYSKGKLEDSTLVDWAKYQTFKVAVAFALVEVPTQLLLVTVAVM